MKTLSTLIVALGLLSMTSVAHAQKSELNVADSKITWTGEKIGGSHTGHIKLLSGHLEKSGNDFITGKFIVDMTSISNLDIKDPESKAKLVGHLKSDDFFSVDEYPTATLEIKHGKQITPGKYKFKGDMTIKGKTNPVSFESLVDDNTFTGKLTIDRSKYNVRYGSDSFFNNLGDNLIYDDFDLDFKVVFK